jgi:hypothetical protein
LLRAAAAAVTKLAAAAVLAAYCMFRLQLFLPAYLTQLQLVAEETVIQVSQTPIMELIHLFLAQE